jgi:site-specific recombinase XerD
MEQEKIGLPQENTSTPEQDQAILNSKSIALRQASDEYLSYVKSNFSVSTYRAYKSILGLVSLFFGPSKSVIDISSREIERYKNAKMQRQLSPHTVNYELRCLRAFFNVLVRWQMVKQNPCNNVKRIRIDDTIRAYLSREELTTILAATGKTQLHAIILFAVLTGLRRGEILNLTWDDIYLEKRKIIIRSTSTFRTKTGKLRTLPIGSELHKLLDGMPDKRGLLFKGEGGKSLRSEFVSKQFKKAVIRCKLNPKLHFHSLRHTFGSYLVEQGVSLYHVQQLMGHSSPFVTQIYAHLGTAELMDSVEKIGVVV